MMRCRSARRHADGSCRAQARAAAGAGGHPRRRSAAGPRRDARPGRDRPRRGPARRTTPPTYLAAQRAFHLRHDPAGMDELAGIAEGFGLDADELVRPSPSRHPADLKAAARPAVTAAAPGRCRTRPDGPLLVKNRDYTGAHLGIQRVALHRGRTSPTGRDALRRQPRQPGRLFQRHQRRTGWRWPTPRSRVRRHRVGWLRYFLMTRLLAECATSPRRWRCCAACRMPAAARW